MLVDLEATPDWQPRERYDLCIAGGGVAGITLALTLAAEGRSILLLEAASHDRAAASQALYEGEQGGHPNVPLTTARLRSFGGSSGHWGGWCRPLDAEDFRARPDVPLSGWPIGQQDLAPFLARAAELIGIVPPAPDGPPPAPAAAELKPVFMAFSPPPCAFPETYGAALAAAPTLDLVLNANLVACEFEAASGVLQGFGFRRLAEPALRWGRAERYVLALGGIETARLLLILNRAHGDRLGNAYGWVGRCYMQHLHATLGELVLFDRGADGPDALVDAAGASRFFALTPGFMLAEGLGNVRLYPLPETCPTPSPPPAWLPIGCRLVPLGILKATGEQFPDPASRVELGAGEDALGLPPTRLVWRPAAVDKRSLRLAGLAFGGFVARSGQTRLRLADWLLVEDALLPTPDPRTSDLGAAAHHLGTYRMAASERLGVADADALVWGTRNLYLAGAGLFPTGGHANPTLTVVQLALRLAQHLGRLADKD